MAKHSSLAALFTAIADAIRAKTGGTEAIVADDFPEAITAISTGVERLITNDDSIVPTGTYATSTYYNVDFGVKIGYCPNGDIILAMKGGTSTSYENIVFLLGSAPDGVSIVTTSSTSYDTANSAGGLYCCVIKGLTVPSTIAVEYSERNTSYDYISFKIIITAN